MNGDEGSGKTMKRAYEILNRVFGYADFRLNQKAVVASLLAGRDAFVLMPTGGGKSLCYQIPSLVGQGMGVVISPLIALMQDQVDTLQQMGVRAAFLNSSQSSGAAQRIEKQLRAGQIDLIYVAPERLLTDPMLELLDQVQAQHRIALFAIDEAHCVSQWGHDFRPEYRQLSLLATRYPTTPRLALTATADLRTRREIVEQLRLQQADSYINSFDRPNIHYAISEGLNPKQQLWDFITTHHANEAGIVYCLSRNKVEKTAEWLAAKGRVALPYHAGLSPEIRRHNQARFLREEGVIMVATIAFGMGIDKPNVRFVAHMSLPKSIESYYQETGRAGRDGERAHAWMAYGLQDVIMLRQIMAESGAAEQQKRVEQHKLQSMLGFCEMITCRRQALLNYLGETGSAPCGNCDNCLNQPETWDATLAARKALSCVFRTGQRFGVNYVIDVLLGNGDDPRIVRNGHHQLSTFGLGTELGISAWRLLFRQLISLGYLNVDLDGHGVIKLTESARPLLRGEAELFLRKERIREKKAKPKAKVAARAVLSSDQPLFDLLRQLRSRLATEQGVPPYVIFHDSTLQQMAQHQPQTLHEMTTISGVGEAKLKRYGTLFLDEIQKWSGLENRYEGG